MNNICSKLFLPTQLRCKKSIHIREGQLYSPRLQAKIPLTKVTSNAVGTTLKSIALSAKLIDLDPLSMARAKAPVFRSRWNCMSKL